MQYLIETNEIKAQIAKFALTKTLWLDTEIADWDTSFPRLSLIQVLANPTDLTGESAYILDVLQKPDIAVYFINQIMVNPQIKKVFHNAIFDLKYLGEQLAKNVTCTLKLARKIKREVLQVSNLKLKTLATELCNFTNVDTEEQGSDWGQRPLTQDYLNSQTLPATAPVKIAIGVNLEGQLVEADLSDPNTCHFLVGGTTGSGKSEFLRSLLLSLLVRHSPQQLQIALVDPKRVTFPEFEQMRWLYSPIVKDSDRAVELMEELVTEMESRYQRFEKAGCADVSAYNQRSQKPLSRIVCIFDEYADFMAEKETRTALEQSIKRLGAMARAAGIHLIIATQRPEAKVVTPIIRSNLPGRVALRTASEADSAIVLGGRQTAAGYLLGKGDLLYQVGAQLHRLQSLLVINIQLPSVL